MVRLIFLISQGLLRDGRMRRTLMFYSVLLALVILFAGATFLDGWLRLHPLVFLLYWAVCAWATLFSVLLALFDMLMVRRAARQERRRLAQNHLSDPASASDENTPGI